MRQVKQELKILAQSRKNTGHPLVYALTQHAAGQPQVKPIIPESGFTPAEVQIFKKLTISKSCLKEKNGILNFGDKMIMCDEIHCDMFKCFANHFLVPSIRILIELFKNDYLLLDKNLFNNHKDCGCRLNPFVQYHQVSPLKYY